jgi:type II secretory pathway pseudopilin PulG
MYTMSKQEEGFTIIEALAAIGIISAAGMIVLGVLSSSIKGIDRARESLGLGAKLLLTDDLIRRKTGAVRLPYWERGFNIIEDNSSIQIPWYRGRAGDYLRFFWDEDSLSMETGSGEERETLVLLEGTDHIRIDILAGGEGIPYGLDIAYTYGGREYHTRTSFSSLPVQLGRP